MSVPIGYEAESNANKQVELRISKPGAIRTTNCCIIVYGLKTTDEVKDVIDYMNDMFLEDKDER